MTDDFISDMSVAFAFMSKSSALNDLYAKKLKREGQALLSSLLGAIARAEKVHARRTLMYLRGKIGDPAEYLTDLSHSKQTDATEKYPQISEKLGAAGNKKAAEAFDQFGEAARIHMELLRELIEGNVYNSMTYYVCQICGYIAKNIPPSNCPVCNAVQEKFKME